MTLAKISPHPRPQTLHITLLSAIAACAALLSMPAQADSDHRSVPLLKSYQAECSTCHIAYPPSMLGASAWQRTMARLEHHFGSDASLDETTVNEISTWLQAHAGRRSDLQDPPQDRITNSRWFLREHREITERDWRSPQVGSASHCMACHQGADKFGFDEDDVRLPEGVRQNAWWHKESQYD